ncbi:VCBS domain-containing protein, partial [Desulforhopalus vacuolatus]|uniref:VCBS domain-containing protein n=2 Tax=Desulforhopalus vacuolatus TaxID=40414 RepID=UPI0019650638
TDAPVIAVVDVAGDIIEGTTLSDTGSITFTDVDLTDLPLATEVTSTVDAVLADGSTPLTLNGTQQAAIEAAFTIANVGTNTNDGSVTWDYTITEGELDFLAEGETVTAVFTITVDDQNGGTDTQDVTITITGATDAPVIAVVDVAGDIIEGTTLSDTGSITFTDVDLTDLPLATEVTSTVDAVLADGSTPLTLNGTQQAAIEAAFTIANVGTNTNDGSVTWDYTITEGELDFLAEGETVTAVFTITVDDQNGGTDTQDVTITITGA